MSRILIAFRSLAVFCLIGLLGSSCSHYNRFNRKVRNERYDSAITFGKRHVENLREAKSESRFIKKALPFYIGMGRVYRNMGDYRAAEQLYLDAHELSLRKQSTSKNNKLGREDLDLMDALADMQLELGNYKRAGELLETSIKERKESMSRTNLERYRPYLFYAKYLMAVGKNDEAYQYLRDYVLYIHNTYHTSYEDLDRFAEAYETLARVELERGDLEKAQEFAEKNLRYQKHRWVRQRAGKNNLNRVESNNLMARCFMYGGDFAKAREYNDKAFTLYNEAIGKPTIYKVPVLMLRGEMLMNQKKYDSAFRYFKEANQIQMEFSNLNFSRLSEYEKENFASKLKQNTALFFVFVSEALKQNVSFTDELLTEAYRIQVNSKAKILDESNRLLKAISSTENTEIKKAYAEWNALKNEYARLVTTGDKEENSTRIATLERRIDELDKSINSMASQSLSGVSHVVSPEEISKRLDNDDVAIEAIRIGKYTAGASGKVKKVNESDPEYLLLAITNEKSVPGYQLIQDGTYLETKGYRYYSNTKKTIVDDTLSFDYYFKPIRELAHRKKTIYFSPDGIFNLVNLTTLKNGGRFVLDSYRIVNVTNTKNIQLSSSRSVYTTATLFGRPKYNEKDLLPIGENTHSTVANRAIVNFDTDINDLPGTEIEVKAIRDLLVQNDIDTQLRLHADATEGALKQNRSTDILHIATHGFFLNETDAFTNPMLRSGLLFSGITDRNKNNEDDGILTAYEATLLNLSKTKLVVLSACETGLGDIRNGEGIYGLQRAFEAAGVRNILMSLWQVDDEATMELMKTFYEELLKNTSPVTALHRAQTKVREKYPHPYYWGAFKVVGD